jgi:hypothetical protein
MAPSWQFVSDVVLSNAYTMVFTSRTLARWYQHVSVINSTVKLTYKGDRDPIVATRAIEMLTESLQEDWIVVKIFGYASTIFRNGVFSIDVYTIEVVGFHECHERFEKRVLCGGGFGKVGKSCPVRAGVIHCPSADCYGRFSQVKVGVYLRVWLTNPDLEAWLSFLELCYSLE